MSETPSTNTIPESHSLIDILRAKLADIVPSFSFGSKGINRAIGHSRREFFAAACVLAAASAIPKGADAHSGTTCQDKSRPLVYDNFSQHFEPRETIPFEPADYEKQEVLKPLSKNTILNALENAELFGHPIRTHLPLADLIKLDIREGKITTEIDDSILSVREKMEEYDATFKWVNISRGVVMIYFDTFVYAIASQEGMLEISVADTAINKKGLIFEKCVLSTDCSDGLLKLHHSKGYDKSRRCRSDSEKCSFESNKTQSVHIVLEDGRTIRLSEKGALAVSINTCDYPVDPDDNPNAKMDFSVPTHEFRLKNKNDLLHLLHYFKGYEATVFQILDNFGKKYDDVRIDMSSLESIKELREIFRLIGKNPMAFSAFMRLAKVRYKTDYNPRLAFRHPVTTFREGWGDCNDHAILAFYWAHLHGYQPYLAHVDTYKNKRRQKVGHVFVWFLDGARRTVVLDNGIASRLFENDTLYDYIEDCKISEDSPRKKYNCKPVGTKKIYLADQNVELI
ncbi:hypothetical protein JW752_04490 [Candidatus Peregrinibacteria bacterium]|nr:hypothetical protein [Candidatus Peregrinibacteria bacterium]